MSCGRSPISPTCAGPIARSLWLGRLDESRGLGLVDGFETGQRGSAGGSRDQPGRERSADHGRGPHHLDAPRSALVEANPYGIPHRLRNGRDVTTGPRYAVYAALVAAWAGLVLYGVRIARRAPVTKAEAVADERELEPVS